MKNNRTELAFILDRSGSMSGLESDTIGGFNAFMQKQQALPDSCHITTVLFDDRYELLHDRLDIQAVSPVTEKEYFVRGSTALLDAIGKTINKIAQTQKQSKPEYRADKVLFVITTDGMENASREFSYSKIKELIEQQKTKYQWEFLFLGANIDAVATAGQFGITPDRAQNYHADHEGVAVVFESVACAATTFREQAAMPMDWNAEINKDYKQRGGKH